ncbi:hypothetical protein GCM10010324_02910 [Streptomyces hiroshimensis]|uniref:Uncharacterized protein n=1 Tax=Streptomyces hiroshimensis TaxID=66424 RepID=A0ABQ2Y3G4_9ACTN|nr:hypothetical protein GCM10010324_02910 [Streptomyces hiroshimensis]
MAVCPSVACGYAHGCARRRRMRMQGRARVLTGLRGCARGMLVRGIGDGGGAGESQETAVLVLRRQRAGQMALDTRTRST